jgi:uncharacterized protein (TIGR02453 family)
MAAFRGFPADALTFFAELEANNNRPWWLENKERFEATVRGPLLALIDELEPTFGAFSVFRPNRDIRFSKDKSPYKTNIGAVSESEGGGVYYVHLDATGLMAAAGYYMMAKDQIERYREAVAAERSGRELIELAAALAAKKLVVTAGGEGELKTAPRGYAADHPRIEWLRRKGLVIATTFGAPKWIHTHAAMDRVTALWVAAEPLNDWLDRHVGPSTLPPPDYSR